MPAGRPTIMDELTLQKLEEAFSNDATDVQACFLANISPATLYNYQKEHPEFLERKKALKEMTVYQAKINVKNKVMEGDIETSKWLLPKREKERYSERHEVTGKDGKDLPTPLLAYVRDDSTEKTNSTEEQN